MAKARIRKRSEFAETIKKTRLQRGLDQQALAELVHVTSQYISHIERGKRVPSEKTLEKIAKALKLNPQGLIQSLYRHIKPSVYEAFLRPDPEMFSLVGRYIPGHDRKYLMDTTDATGRGNVVAYVGMLQDLRDERVHALLVRGDSMAPRFEDGDIIIASASLEIKSGDLVVLSLKNGVCFFRRIRFKNTFFILEAVNPAFETMKVSKEDIIWMHKILWVQPMG